MTMKTSERKVRGRRRRRAWALSTDVPSSSSFLDLLRAPTPKRSTGEHRPGASVPRDSETPRGFAGEKMKRRDELNRGIEEWEASCSCCRKKKKTS